MCECWILENAVGIFRNREIAILPGPLRFCPLTSFAHGIGRIVNTLSLDCDASLTVVEILTVGKVSLDQ